MFNAATNEELTPEMATSPERGPPALETPPKNLQTISVFRHRLLPTKKWFDRTQRQASNLKQIYRLKVGHVEY